MTDPLVELNAFSRSYWTALRDRFPWLEDFATVDPNPPVDPGSLLVECPAPSGRERSRLWVSTHGGEVTIGFGRFHDHSEWPKPAKGFWEDPNDFIQAIIKEDIRIEERFVDGKWVQSSTLNRDEEPETHALKEKEVVTVRSWTGERDETIEEDGSAASTEC